MNPRRVAVLGSTGSIGRQALEVISSREDLLLHSILCGSDLESLSDQVSRFSPGIAAVVDPAESCPGSMVCGPSAVRSAVEGADLVLNAIVGSAGLEASILCRDLGIPLALANKESLVVGGELLREFIASGRVIPVDSEHSTIFRCLQGERDRVRGVTLTASGGSARDVPLDEIDHLPVHRILDHPTWRMGARITVDSATMVNKAFEVIEAGWLFPDLPVDVVVHPQSIVHSLVRLSDGSWKALLGQPDMSIPLQYALTWPRCDNCVIARDGPLDWGPLEFMPLESGRYPAFDVVSVAGNEGGTAPAAANAADEVAVEAYLEDRISFGDIAVVISSVLEGHRKTAVSSLEDVMNADAEARASARKVVDRLCSA
ncbi:MAG: hypothetical protein AVO35_00950 [Candidatus Aegiribacteria sp. MLS_C]|nr:MAG: hypothetical protein AVO35_00950 [Candidatus Aegiribacteria sp. MLS_C]